MGCGVGCRPGGILGLLRLLTEHGEAVEYDLITLGLRLDWLGTRRLSWRDLLVLVRQSPATSALTRAVVGPEVAAWNAGVVTADLLAVVVDALQIANWQRAGKKAGPRPKPLKRPSQQGKRIRGTAMSLDDLDARLGYSPRT